MNNQKNVYSVSQVNRYIKDMFVNEYALSVIFVKGEVSNCKYHSSGHIYFTIKDKASQISCVMFAGQRGGLSFRMEDGQEVIVGGSISVYERDGKYQMYAKRIELSGEGDLYEKYEKLKQTMLAQGYFDAEHKKPIPSYASKVGIVTASTGAALQDIVNISTRRNPFVQLILYPAKVQGDGAAQTVIQGIQALEGKVDTIIIGRGGGSIEDLWAFNEEELAKVIYACKTPIISAVGHETDTTIADYVADMRAPTPSAAAELAVYDVELVLEMIEDAKVRMVQAMEGRIQRSRMELKHSLTRLKLVSPENQLIQKRQYLLELESKLFFLADHKVEQVKHQLALLGGRLNAQSPLNRLQSGFAYVANQAGEMVANLDKVQTGDKLDVTMRSGIIKAEVLDVDRKDTVEWLKNKNH